MTKPECPIAIRPAHASERVALEDLQRRASMEGPLYREQLAAHPDAIELPAEQIAAGLVRLADLNGRVVGFAVLLDPLDGVCELDGLFVEPEFWRAGIGRRLIEDATEIARKRGAGAIEVDANPQAVQFYERVGFVVAGEARTRFGPAPRMALRLPAVD